jgi:hypothetical protein
VIQYGRTAMRTRRQHSATRAVLVLAMVLGSLWAGGPGPSAEGGPVDQLAASRALPGLEPATRTDRVPALRPPVQRPAPSARPLPLVAGVLAAALTLACWLGGRRRRSGRAAARPPGQRLRLVARPPPSLQPA